MGVAVRVLGGGRMGVATRVVGGGKWEWQLEEEAGVASRGGSGSDS